LPPTPQALLHGLIALQKKIDGQSLANMDDVPWYGVGPSEPTPIPILGPDIVDPRQMEIIRRQAELAAAGQSYGVRELPAHRFIDDAPKKVLVATQAATLVAETTEISADDAQRLTIVKQRREEAVARKRARDAAKG
jgi:hypothetical protein